MAYYPLQLNGKQDYKESQAPAYLQDKIVCYWEITTNQNNQDYLIIPDGCVDLVVKCCSQPKVFLSPSLIHPNIINLGETDIWFGIRFKPGILPSMLNINLSELEQKMILFADVAAKWSKELEEQLATTTTFQERINTSNQILLNLKLGEGIELNQKVAAVLYAVYESKGSLVLKNQISQTIPMSNRQIRRLFHQHIGLSPKKFTRIVRCQNFLNELKINHKSKSYYETYFDQAHMIKEIKDMTQLTPKQLSPYLNY